MRKRRLALDPRARAGGKPSYWLVAGDAYYFDSRLPHRFRNLDAETCETVSVCTPPSF